MKHRIDGEHQLTINSVFAGLRQYLQDIIHTEVKFQSINNFMKIIASNSLVARYTILHEWCTALKNDMNNSLGYFGTQDGMSLIRYERHIYRSYVSF